MSDKASITAAVGIGAVLAGRYRIESILGKGRTGIVYEVRDLQLASEPLALKMLYAHLYGSSEALERFSREAHLVRQLAHPNIIRLYDLDFRDPERPFYTMELIRGMSLRELLDLIARPWTEEEVCSLLGQLLGALHAAHVKGILHRDIKPENILFTQAGVLKLADFGCGFSAEHSQHLTKTGELVGSPAYMAPELFVNAAWSPAADIYAVGTIAYELLCQQTPFIDTSLFALIESHRSRTPEWSKLDKLDISDPIKKFIKRSLAKEATERHSSATQALAELNLHSDSLSTQPLADLVEEFGYSPRTQPASRLRAVLVHSLAVLVTVILLKIFFSNKISVAQLRLSILSMEQVLSFDLPPLRYVASMPEISLNRQLTLDSAIMRGDLEALQLWCHNRRFPVYPFQIDAQQRNSVHRLATQPALLVAIEHFNDCFPSQLYDRPDSNGKTPLTEVVLQQHVAAVRQLVLAGYNPNMPDRAGKSALRYAVESGNTQLIDALTIHRSRFPDLSKSFELLRASLRSGSVEALQSLIALGIDLGSRDENGKSILMYLHEAPHVAQEPMFSVLIEAGASCSSRDDFGHSVRDYLQGTYRDRGGSPIAAAKCDGH